MFSRDKSYFDEEKNVRQSLKYNQNGLLLYWWSLEVGCPILILHVLDVSLLFSMSSNSVEDTHLLKSGV